MSTVHSHITSIPHLTMRSGAMAPEQGDLVSEPSAVRSTAAAPTTLESGGSAENAELDEVIDVALACFSRDGYAATKLEDIARRAGMSKRMIHYHFGDKRELYRLCLIRAWRNFTPPQDFLERSYAVPVEGIRRFVDTLFHRMVQNPNSIRIMLRENLDPILTDSERAAMHNESEVLLQIERLLLMGQDVGAFRPGIAATDVVVLIASLTFFRTGSHATAESFGGINLSSPANTEGMRRLTIDAVLTFLTSNIPDSGYESYLTAQSGSETRVVEAADEEVSADYLSGTSIAEPLIDDIYEPSGE